MAIQDILKRDSKNLQNKTQIYKSNKSIKWLPLTGKI